MLQSTFLHINGVGVLTERKIWQSNIYTWQEFLERGREGRVRERVEESLSHFGRGNVDFFRENLPSSYYWRAYKEFKENCCFLDIETTGLDRDKDIITAIGIYNGKEVKTFIEGKNIGDFAKELNRYGIIVTFNGKCFDVPFINRAFPEVKLDKMHIDLRFEMAKLGYSGGLKAIERHFRIKRDREIEGLDGADAVRLWHNYERGDNHSLFLLRKYLESDIISLKPLMEIAYDKLKVRHFYSFIE